MTSSLRFLVESTNKRVPQITLFHLLHGYYPTYSLAIALGCFVIFFAFACNLFSSIASFLSLVITVLMINTLLYKHLGGSFTTTQSGAIVDVLYDVWIRSTIRKLVFVLYEGARAQRILLLACIVVVGQLGKILKTSLLCTVFCVVWIIYLCFKYKHSKTLIH